MIVQYCSDLHLEFHSNSMWLKAHPIQPVGDILIIAGDTFLLSKQFTQHPFFDEVSKLFKAVYLIPGNHEYYSGQDASKSFPHLHEMIRPNVHLINNYAVQIENIQFLFTTLWSEIKKYVAEVMIGMTDFRVIQYQGKALTIENFNFMHQQSLDFLKQEIAKYPDRKTVVVTHHLPSALCNAEEHKNSKLNEAFCVNLTEFIELSKVKLWIYGHNHRNKSAFQIGQTTLLTNQLGYVAYGEHKDFRVDAKFEI